MPGFRWKNSERVKIHFSEGEGNLHFSEFWSVSTGANEALLTAVESGSDNSENVTK